MGCTPWRLRFSGRGGPGRPTRWSSAHIGRSNEERRGPRLQCDICGSVTACRVVGETPSAGTGNSTDGVERAKILRYYPEVCSLLYSTTVLVSAPLLVSLSRLRSSPLHSAPLRATTTLHSAPYHAPLRSTPPTTPAISDVVGLGLRPQTHTRLRGKGAPCFILPLAPFMSSFVAPVCASCTRCRT